MARAQVSTRAGRLEEANRYYAQVLAIDRNNCSALDRCSENFAALGQYKQALVAVDRWVALSPSDLSYIRRMSVFVKLRKTEAALSDLDRALKLKEVPNQIEYLMIKRAIVRMMAGHFRDGRADAYNHMTMVPRSVLSVEICSVADALCGRPADAISNLAQFISIKLHKGATFYSSPSEAYRKQWSQTKSHSASELRSPQTQAQYSYRMEGAFRQGAMTDDEREQIMTRLEKDHSSLSPAQYHFARGIIYFFQGNYDHASAEAAQCATGSMQVHSQLLTCYCHILKKEFPRAREILNHLTALFPESECVLCAVDIYHFEADERQDSIVEMKSLLAKHPKNLAAMFELAKIYSDLSEPTDALKYCDLALQFNPKSTDLLLMKAHILTNQKKYEEGLKTLATIVAIDDQNGAAYFARAAIYTQQGRWSDAIEDLTKSIQLRYDLCKSLQARAACYGTLKRFDLARKDLSLVKAIDSGANLQRLPD
jgi:tetratricopeptide (TPR) repeat protein